MKWLKCPECGATIQVINSGSATCIGVRYHRPTKMEEDPTVRYEGSRTKEARTG